MRRQSTRNQPPSHHYLHDAIFDPLKSSSARIIVPGKYALKHASAALALKAALSNQPPILAASLPTETAAPGRPLALIGQRAEFPESIQEVLRNAVSAWTPGSTHESMGSAPAATIICGKTRDLGQRHLLHLFGKDAECTYLAARWLSAEMLKRVSIPSDFETHPVVIFLSLACSLRAGLHDVGRINPTLYCGEEKFDLVSQKWIVEPSSTLVEVQTFDGVPVAIKIGSKLLKDTSTDSGKLLLHLIVRMPYGVTLVDAESLLGDGGRKADTFKSRIADLRKYSRDREFIVLSHDGYRISARISYRELVSVPAAYRL